MSHTESIGAVAPTVTEWPVTVGATTPIVTRTPQLDKTSVDDLDSLILKFSAESWCVSVLRFPFFGRAFIASGAERGAFARGRGRRAAARGRHALRALTRGAAGIFTVVHASVMITIVCSACAHRHLDSCGLFGVCHGRPGEDRHAPQHRLWYPQEGRAAHPVLPESDELGYGGCDHLDVDGLGDAAVHAALDNPPHVGGRVGRERNNGCPSDAVLRLVGADLLRGRGPVDRLHDLIHKHQVNLKVELLHRVEDL
mmetsp:Transcript_13176/g.33793  ORF Transcript_13176/g.33793 Transcript_13176/m.33793 type:complete len:255 (+) Transcript_13176:154-918(+)